MQELISVLEELIEKYLSALLEFVRLNCSHLVPVLELNAVQSFTNLFDSLATAENGVCTLRKVSRYKITGFDKLNKGYDFDFFACLRLVTLTKKQIMFLE